MTTRSWAAKAALALLGLAAQGAVQAQSGTVYRCPGPPVLYTDQLSAAEAKEKGCRLVEGTPVTVIQSRPPAAAAPASVPRPAEARIDPSAQQARDTERRRILESELRREEARLAELKQEYNDGQPERRGDERNYQRYLDRVAELKSGIARKEADIAALKRELAKLPSP